MKTINKIDFDKPSIEKPHAIEVEGSGKGVQKIWKFKNGYGASVVRFSIKSMLGKGYLGGNYGSEKGLWELAVIKFDKDSWSLTYETKITNDVIGYLTESEVEDHLKRIKELK